MNPKIGAIRRHNGVAGQIAYSVDVTYPDEPTSTVTFVGSVYGPPIVMVLPSGVQTFVSNPERYGTFGPEWVRRFFTKDN